MLHALILAVTLGGLLTSSTGVTRAGPGGLSEAAGKAGKSPTPTSDWLSGVRNTASPPSGSSTSRWRSFTTRPIRWRGD